MILLSPDEINQSNTYICISLINVNKVWKSKANLAIPHLELFALSRLFCIKKWRDNVNFLQTK